MNGQLQPNEMDNTTYSISQGTVSSLFVSSKNHNKIINGVMVTRFLFQGTNQDL